MFKKYYRYVLYILIIVRAIMCVVYFFQDYDFSSESNNKVLAFSGFEYMIISLIYLIIGVLIQRKLKTAFPEFYQTNGIYVQLATIILTASLSFRAIVDLLRVYSTPFYDWTKHHEGIYSLIFFIFC